MPRLPPAEKLPLAVRKNIRDKFDAKKEELEKELSDKLGTAWTIDINPNAIYPYATQDWAKESLGACIASYVSNGIYQLDYFKTKQGQEGVDELNSLASKHVLSMDADDTGNVSYCASAIEDGRLVIVFNPTELGTNDNEAMQLKHLLKAINDAPPAPGAAAPTLSFTARNSIRNDYDKDIAEVHAEIGKILAKPDIVLVPNFEAVYATLKQASQTPGSKVASDWESRIGALVWCYFDGLRSKLRFRKFDSDEMLQEGFHDAVSTGTIEFRIVDKIDRSYCEVAIEDGKLFIQTTVEEYGVNADDAADKIIDLL